MKHKTATPSMVRVYGTREEAFLRGEPIEDFTPTWWPTAPEDSIDGEPVLAAHFLKRDSVFTPESVDVVFTEVPRWQDQPISRALDYAARYALVAAGWLVVAWLVRELVR